MHFIDAVRPGDPLAVVQFADKAEIVADLQIARDEALRSAGPTHAQEGDWRCTMARAAHDGAAEKPCQGRRVVVVVTDGRDENAASTAAGSVATWDMVLGAARAIDVTAYAIGLGTGSSEAAYSSWRT